MRVDEVLKQATNQLQPHSATPRLDAEVLLTWVLNVSKAEMISRLYDTLTVDTLETFWSALERRRKGEPLAYIRGYQEFYGRDFLVSPAVLIPRPETEHLIECCLERCRSSGPLRILDLGTGSGCISVTLACELEARSIAHQITAVDRSVAALGLARENAERYGVAERIQFLEGSWYEPLATDDCFDCLLSNPPYVPRDADNRSPETDFEPPEALFHEKETLESYREIAADCHRYLNPGAFLAVEHGQGQSDAVGDIFREAPIGELLFTSGIIRDLAGIDRIFFLETKSF